MLSRLTHTLLHRLERSLGGLVAGLEEALDGLLAGRMLLAAHDATRLGLHEILLVKATAGVLGRSVKYLRLRASGDLMFGHCVYLERTKKSGSPGAKKIEGRLG